MPKRRDLTIEFRLPKGSEGVKATIKPDGEILLKDKDGNEVVPEYMERTVHYERSKGPKIQTQQKAVRGLTSVGGLKEFAQFDSVFVVDTNTTTVNGEKVSAACFVCYTFTPEGDKFRIDCEGKLNIYELHNVPGNPEMLAILKLAHDVVNSIGPKGYPNIAVVTDSGLQSHSDINARTQPIYGQHYLPQGFSLHYASSDTGQEAINRLIKLSDKQSSKYLQYLEEGSIKGPEPKILTEDPVILYRFMFRDDLEIVNPVVGGIAIPPGTTVSLYGRKDPDKKS